MLEIDIPGFGPLKLEHLVSDFTGTLSVDGKLLPNVKTKMNRLSRSLKIHVLTADTFGTAKKALKGVRCEVHILKEPALDVKKENFVMKLGSSKVVAFGNGMNDRRMLKTARVGIIVMEDEGSSSEALIAANIAVKSIDDALDLLLKPKRIKATLRF